MKNLIEVKNLSKDYADPSGFNVHLLEDISINIEEGSITSIVAPTGAGKSSLLRILGNLESLTGGTINNNFENKKIVYIPSQASSYPWYSVRENLMLLNIDEKLFKEIIHLVGLEGYEDHYPDNNSLAFRLRISLGRAIAANAGTIILDEPFLKNIKQESLERIYELILLLKSTLGLTIVMGTSNLSESILLSDKIYLMKKNPGKIFDSIDISFEQNRDVKQMSSEKFNEYRSLIEQKMKSEPSQILSNITV